MKNILPLLFMVTLVACGTSKDSRPQAQLKIGSPLLSEFTTDDKNLRQALDQIIAYLASQKESMDSLYLTDYQTDSIPWEFRIDHYRTFVVLDKFRRELAAEDSIMKLGSAASVEVPYVTPPVTGNWSGHDRWITYNPRTKELNDYLDQ